MIAAMLMAQAIVSSVGQTGGVTTGSVDQVNQGQGEVVTADLPTCTPKLIAWGGRCAVRGGAVIKIDPKDMMPVAVVPSRSMACGGNEPNANIEVCISDDGRRLLRLEFPPCGTPAASKATHCLEWEIKKPAGPPLWHYKPVERQ